MKKIILTLALAAVAALSANAQIGVGVGYASTTLKGDNTTTNLGGLTFGASYNIPIVAGTTGTCMEITSQALIRSSNSMYST